MIRMRRNDISEMKGIVQRLPSVSVVIPCYNVERYVAQTVRSVLSQSYAPEDILCVDDGSTDNTLNVLNRMKSSGAPITVLSQTNQGGNPARNVGLNAVDSEYVQFLDSDDVLKPSKLEHQASIVARTHPKPDFIAAAYEKELEDKGYDGKAGERGVNPDPWRGLITIGLGITSSNLWRTAALRGVGGWNVDYHKSQEYELMYRLLKSCAVVYRDTTPLTVIRKRSDSVSNADRAESRRVALQLLCKIQQHLKSHGLMTEQRKADLLYMSFMKSHQLFKDDPSTAVSMHDKLLTSEYIPRTQRYDLGRVYTAMYRIGGFRTAEAAYPLWSKLRKFLS